MSLSVMHAVAQTDSTRTYLIEVIVFENTGPDSADNELFGRRIEWKLDETAPIGGPQINSSALNFVQTGTLEKLVAGISSSSRYKVLKQVAWIQPAAAKNDAPLVSIVGSPMLSGQVRVYSRKLLFVELELRLIRPLTNMSHTTVPYSSRYYQSPVFLVKETRRLKLNEIHYFDHPRFGALLKVSRWTRQP